MDNYNILRAKHFVLIKMATMKYLINICFILLIVHVGFGQDHGTTIEGYIYESGNRGYITGAQVTILNDENGSLVGKALTDEDGFFSIFIEHAHDSFTVKAQHKVYFSNVSKVSFEDAKEKKKSFVKIELERRPGYIFDVTLAENNSIDKKATVDAIQGAKIEIYNNTSAKESLVIDSLPSPNFNFTFEQGNHYTVMVRKKGFLTKRMEAYINIDGCILCFEGITEVTDVMSRGNEIGTFLANIEMDKIDINTTFDLKNIYYDYDESFIREDASLELDKVVNVLKDNPAISVELGSHTDSRGKDAYNMQLSDARAAAAVRYLVDNGIAEDKLSSRGYGESQLVNGCRNGVTCSEDDHQLNRRTMLKITGIEKVDPLDNKSLKQIIEEDLILQNLDNQQIRINPGEDLPEEIKKDIQKLREGNN